MSGKTPRLRFATYNIHKAVGVDGTRDADRIIAVLREVDADVIALQEADRRFGDRESVLPRALLDDTPWKVVPVAKRPRSIGWHGNALLVRRTYDVVHSHPLPLPTLEPRGAVAADLRIGDAELRVVGMHLDLSGLRRREQLQAVLEHCGADAQHRPTVLMGDFNQWGRTSGAMRILRPDWHDAPCGASFPSRRPIAPLDRIVLSREWHCHEAGIHHSALSARASDHLPAWAVLGL